MKDSPHRIPKGPLSHIVVVYAFVSVRGAMDAHHSAAGANPFLEGLLFRIIEEDSCVIVENDDVYRFEPFVGEAFAIAGLSEIPALFFSEFGKHHRGFGTRLCVIEKRRRRGVLSELVDSVNAELRMRRAGEAQYG